MCAEGWRHDPWWSGEWKTEGVVGQLQQQLSEAERLIAMVFCWVGVLKAPPSPYQSGLLRWRRHSLIVAVLRSVRVPSSTGTGELDGNRSYGPEASPGALDNKTISDWQWEGWGWKSSCPTLFPRARMIIYPGRVLTRHAWSSGTRMPTLRAMCFLEIPGEFYGHVVKIRNSGKFETHVRYCP